MPFNGINDQSVVIIVWEFYKQYLALEHSSGSFPPTFNPTELASSEVKSFWKANDLLM